MPKNSYREFDYSSKMSELESIIESLQDTETSIDKALDLHTEGVKLAAELEDYLQTAEMVIRQHTEKK